MVTATKNFDAVMATLPYAPKTEQASGFLPPFIRGLGHLMTLTSLLNEEEQSKHPSKADMKREVEEAKTHFAAATIKAQFSTEATEYMKNAGDALSAFVKEVGSFDDTKAADNLRNLTNRFLSISAFLDREVLGIRDSDPGSSF